MADEYGTFGIGGVVYPLATGTGNSLLKDLDPTLYEILDFYAGVLVLQLGDRWAAETTAAGRGADLGVGIVQYTTPYDPSHYFEETQAKWPLLTASRAGESYSYQTQTWSKASGTIDVWWCMSPLSTADLERLGPFLTGVARVLMQMTEQGFHPDYQSGRRVLTDAGLMSIGVERAEFVNLASSSNLVFPSVHLVVKVDERQMPVPGGFDPMTGLDTIEDLVTPTGTKTDVVDTKTDF